MSVIASSVVSNIHGGVAEAKTRLGVSEFSENLAAVKRRRDVEMQGWKAADEGVVVHGYGIAGHDDG